MRSGGSGPRLKTSDFEPHDELRYFQRQDLRLANRYGIEIKDVLPSLLPSLVWDSFGSWLRTIRPNSSWQTRYARHFPNFSWLPQKAIPTISRRARPQKKTKNSSLLSSVSRVRKDAVIVWSSLENMRTFRLAS
jgi:hypothetical protein